MTLVSRPSCLASPPKEQTSAVQRVHPSQCSVAVVEGLTKACSISTGSRQVIWVLESRYYVADLGAAAETTFALGGGMGESRTGGPLLNVIPKEGGNSLSGSFYVNGANGAFEGSNFTQAHRDAGLRTPNQLRSIWDVNTNVGGPIQRDRVWFFSAFRHQGNRKTVANMWANRNAGDQTKWTYEPDLSHQATDGGNWMNGSVRVTTQLTQRNKISVFWDEQKICRLCEGGEGTATSSPEATPTNEGFPQRHVHASWTSPLTSNWLLDGGVSLNYVQFGGVAKDGDTTGLVRVTEQGGLIPGITYRSTNWTRPTGESWTWRGSASHITGARRIKIGYEGNHHTSQGNNYTNNALLAYQLNNGVPNRLTMTAASPIVNNTHSKDHAVYGQAQWTRQRLTVQAGVRYEYIDSGFPENRIGPSLFLSQPVVFPAQESPVSLHDVAPRFAATYDVFGTGKTALKMSVGRYMLEPAGAQIYANPYSPVSRVVTSTNRAWTDIDTDFAPDCDLLNPATNGECGPLSNVNFGREVFTTNYDRDIVEGWNTRLQTWDINAGVRHELMPRLGIEAEYVRRIFGNFRVTDNQAVGPEDFDTFSITAPVDPRLPDGGGYTISGLFDVKPAKFGAVNNLVILSDTIGKQTRHYNGLNVNVNARLSNGLTVQGGFSSGTTTEDICDIRAKLPELTVTNIGGTVQGVSPLHPYCQVSSGFLTDLSGLATYTVPKINLQVSGTWSSRPVIPHRDSNYTVVPNESLAANAVVTNAQIAPSLGRNLSGGLANATINLVEPGTLYGDRITSLDFRVARVQRLGTCWLLFGIDIYNILNASSVLSYNQTYGPRWLTPTGILQARFAKLSAQLDF